MVTTSTDKIEAFIDSHWPLDDNLRAIQDGTLDPDVYIEILKSKFGPKLIDEYIELINTLIGIEGYSSEENWLSMHDFIFKNRLSADICPYTSLRSRSSLHLLLKYFDSFQGKFTIGDFGCGDGRITIGLAKYLEGAKKVYAVDLLQSATDSVLDNLREESPEVQASLEGRLEIITADYASDEFRRRIPQVDFAVNVIGMYWNVNDPSLPNGVKCCRALANLTKKFGKILFAEQVSNPPFLAVPQHWAFEELVQEVCQRFYQALVPLGFNLKATDGYNYRPDASLILLEATKQS